LTAERHNIDDSHGLLHHLVVIITSFLIYEAALEDKPELRQQLNVILMAIGVHDSFDDKYVKGEVDLKNVKNNFFKLFEDDFEKKILKIVMRIINTMSYSKVMGSTKKKLGSKCGIYVDAYHIVREGDLMDGVTVARCVITSFLVKARGSNVVQCFGRARNLFKDRMFAYDENMLLVNNFTKEYYTKMESKAHKTFRTFNKILGFEKVNTDKGLKKANTDEGLKKVNTDEGLDKDKEKERTKLNNKLLTRCFKFIEKISKDIQIYDSHAYLHSLSVIEYATQIYESKVQKKGNKNLEEQFDVILVSCALHGVLNHKVVTDPNQREEYFNQLSTIFEGKLELSKIETVKKCIKEMSYSNLMKNNTNYKNDIAKRTFKKL